MLGIRHIKKKYKAHDEISHHEQESTNMKTTDLVRVKKLIFLPAFKFF